MRGRTLHPLPVKPPAPLMDVIRKRFSPRELRVVEAVFSLRTTSQQVDNAITEWMAGTAGSPARFQILMQLWAAEGHGVPHKEIVAALGVTRATVSGLMAALERDGLVRSTVDRDDRRNLLATLTSKGETVVEKAADANRSHLRAALASLSSEELSTFAALLQRVRQGFAAEAENTLSRA